MTISKPKAVVLCSGGLDSTTALAIAVEQGFDCSALAVDYGQRHRSELHAVRKIVQAMEVPLKEVDRKSVV